MSLKSPLQSFSATSHHSLGVPINTEYLLFQTHFTYSQMSYTPYYYHLYLYIYVFV